VDDPCSIDEHPLAFAVTLGIVLRAVTATRYVTPLREGGSLPGLMEADDCGTYVIKFRGAGQGRAVLVNEVIAGELSRRLGLPVPELVVVDVDPVLGRAEPDQEVQDLLRASGGANLGMDFLPGSIGFDPQVHPVDPGLASRVLWFDALVGNVDRTWRNPNLLLWHRQLQLIDHGATLTFAHDWSRAAAAAERPYDASGHVLAAAATARYEAAAALAPLVTPELVREVVDLVPEQWLTGEPGFDDAAGVRGAYVHHLLRRAAEHERWRP
jgi:hypothetical protein